MVKNASAFASSSLGKKVSFYSSHRALSPRSFQNALDPRTWRECFDPFACVAVDEETREKVLIRDHLGIAPLYYGMDPTGRLIFGDNLPDVLRAFPQRPRLLNRQVRNIFATSQEYSDETFYDGVYRVEPGHLVHIKANGSLQKKPYWQLAREGEPLRYKREGEYLEHFSELLREAIRWATRGFSNVASEFSAGIDSTAVYLAARAQGLEPKLYMHAALAGSDAESIYEDRQEKRFLELFSEARITRVVSEGFDPIADFQKCAKWFGGPAPYLFPLFVHPLYRAVEAGKHPLLLSGFGGDQGVSGLVPLHFLLPTLIHEKGFREAWRELGKKNAIKKIWGCAMHGHPRIYETARAVKNATLILRNQTPLHPFHKKYFKSLREAEWNFLQGPLSHEVRMRIEYSSVMSKQFGFEYRYPLLYPKLLEFYLAVPPEQKRRDGNGRYLIRRYLAQSLPSEVFDSYRKRTGLGILPGTFPHFQKSFERGDYQHVFSALPYPKLIRNKQKRIELRNSLKAYLLKSALNA